MSKAPDAPDPYATSAAQTQSNQQTANYNADLNRVSQYTPFGSSVYSQNGTGASGAPLYRQDVTLSDLGQQNLDNQLRQDASLSSIGFGLADQANSNLHQPIDTSHLPALNSGPGATRSVQGDLDFSGAPGLSTDFGGLTRQAQDAVYNQATSRLDPQWGNAQHDLDSKLANQGIVQGSEAYDRAQGQFGRERNDAYNQANYSAVGAGNALQNQLYGQNLAARGQAVGETEAQGQFSNQSQAQQYAQALQGAQFGNSARAQGLQESTTLRTLPLNELNALRSQSQVQTPTFTSVPQSQSANTDVAGNIWNSYNANVANSNNFMNGLFGIAGAAASNPAIFASDRRLKRNVVPVGRTPAGLTVYAFEYIWSKVRHIGVMAQDALVSQPEAVLALPSGYLMVDYGKVR